MSQGQCDGPLSKELVEQASKVPFSRPPFRQQTPVEDVARDLPGNWLTGERVFPNAQENE